MTEHIVGRCDICHQEMKELGCRGFIAGIDQITRYCDECWEEEL